MGLLDDLRNQADNQRENEAADADRQAKLEAYYKETMQPRMVKAFQYFTEFVKHLNYIKLETFVEYPLLPKGVPQRLQQQNYKVVIDSSKALKEIKFTMECVLDSPVEFEVFGKDAVLLQVDKIKSYAFRHECKTRTVNQEINMAKFILEGPLPLAVNINADVSESKIRLELRNFNEPGYAKYVLTAEEFNDEFLDRLAKFVIRQERTLFGGEEITEAEKKKLRDKIIVERRIREQEMREAEARIQAEQAAEKERSAKEQLKRAVNTKVAKGKESLKDMFGKLKKQAGFDSAKTETTLPPASVSSKQPVAGQTTSVAPTAVAPKPQPPVSPAAAAPKSPAPPAAAAKPPVPPAAAPKPKPPVSPAAAPKPKPPAPPPAAAPKPQPPASAATTTAPKPEQSAVVPPTTPKPQTQVHSEQKKQEPMAPEQKNVKPPKVYIAPPGNPFITPDEPEPSAEQENDLDLKLEKIKAKAEKNSSSEPKNEKASFELPFTPEELENDLANIMQREAQPNPGVESVQESVKKVEQQATIQPEPKFELAIDPDPALEPKTETKLKAKNEPKPKPEVEPEPKLELDIEPEPKPQVEPAAKLEREMKPEPKLELDIEPELLPEEEPAVKFEREMKPEPKPETDPEPEPKSEVEPEVKFEREMKPEPKPETDPEAKLELDIEPEPKSEVEPEAKLELDIEPESTPEVEPEAKLELDIEPEFKPEVKPELKLELDIESEPEPEAKIAPETKPEPESKAESNPDFALEPDQDFELEQLNEASEGPDIDLSAPPSPTQEEMDSDVPLRSLFPSSNKKTKE